MSVQVERLENNKAKLTIVVPAADLDAAMNKAYNKQKKNIAIPGFRKGKVSRAVVEKMYGKGFFLEGGMNEAIPEAYSKAYDECGLAIVSQPEIDIVQIEPGKDFIFTAEVFVKPEVVLGEYKGLEVDKISTRVTQKEVDAKIEEEAKKNARKVPVERPVENGDEVTLDFEGFVDGVAFDGGKGENYPLVIGSGSFIPGFEEQLVGAEAEKEIEVNVTFPEEYQSADLAGKAATFKCLIHEIKTEEIPEIDDEFASEVSEFDTLEEYKADVKAQIKEAKLAEGKNKQQEQAIDAAVANATIDLPEVMIDNEVDNMVSDFANQLRMYGMNVEQYFQMMGSTEADFRAERRADAEKRVRIRLVLDAIAVAENIEASEEDIEKEVSAMAAQYGMEPEQVKAALGGNFDVMIGDIKVQKAAELLVETAVEK